MVVQFKWDNETKTILRYVAQGDWNWLDYHRAVRISLFSLYSAKAPVDVIFDLRGGSRLPGGAVAHLRTVGKKQHDTLSGRAVIIGLDETTLRQIVPDGGRLLTLGNQQLHFADSDDEAYALLR
jgi:hypothetical protein